ncbi:MAG: hypothetical protein ACYTDW_00410 [Planctomycetota bacterium]
MTRKTNSPKGHNNPKSSGHIMDRRDMLRATGAAVLASSAFPLHWVAAAEKKKQKVLYFSRSAGFEHGAVKLKDGKPSISDRTLTELGKRHGFEVVCTKDGRIFDGDLNQYDAIAFYTSGDLTKPNKAKTPPMSAEGKKKMQLQIPSTPMAPETRTRPKSTPTSPCSAVNSSNMAPSRKPLYAPPRQSSPG